MAVELVELICVILVPIVTYLLYLCIFSMIYLSRHYSERQKTRSQQQRRVYVGSRGRQASVQGEPTIFVSPANLPPPPKYEALAPPSYEEVMGASYQNYQATPVQPITYPLTHAVAQGSRNVQTDSSSTEPAARSTEPAARSTENTNTTSPSTVITVTADDRRTSVTVATS